MTTFIRKMREMRYWADLSGEAWIVWNKDQNTWLVTILPTKLKFFEICGHKEKP